jgi:phage/plasmid-associated DNA primase
VVDLADWVDYTCEGQKISLEKKQAEKDYAKIKQDKVKREDKTVELREEFCSETLKDIDHYQNGLMGLEAELRTIIIGVLLELFR